MKHLIFSIFIFTIISQSYGQQLRLAINSQVKTSTRTFNVREVPNGNAIKVSNSDNKLEKVKQSYLPGDIAFDPNPSEFKKSFKEVFSDQRLNSLLSEKYLFISFYVDPKGNPLEMFFLTPPNTSLSPKEIEKLESVLKRNVSFKVYGSNLERGNYYQVSYLAKYKMLIQ